MKASPVLDEVSMVTFLVASHSKAVQVGTATSSEQAGMGAMAGSRQQVGSQGWTHRVRLQVISKVRGLHHVMLHQLQGTYMCHALLTHLPFIVYTMHSTCMFLA